nr:hypothetical protein CFP56_40409 [Quercus suber]
MNRDGGVKSGIVLAPGVIETITMVDEGRWGSMEGVIVEAVDQIDQFMEQLVEIDGEPSKFDNIEGWSEEKLTSTNSIAQTSLVGSA